MVIWSQNLYSPQLRQKKLDEIFGFFYLFCYHESSKGEISLNL